MTAKTRWMYESGIPSWNRLDMLFMKMVRGRCQRRGWDRCFGHRSGRSPAYTDIQHAAEPFDQHLRIAMGTAVGSLQLSPSPGYRPSTVSQVLQRSPLRCPGGKTWLIPHIRE